MDLGRLLRPRSIAVVGASERDDSYAGETLLNLRGAGFAGPVWGVQPDAPVGARVRVLPVAVGAAGRAGRGGRRDPGRLGRRRARRGGLARLRRGGRVRRGLRRGGPRAWSTSGGCARWRCGTRCRCAGRTGTGSSRSARAPPCGATRCAPLQPGRVAMVSQSGNVAVNALAGRRALRFHTVVSCGNATVVDPAEWVRALARDDDVRSIALYLEGDGDGALLCEALAECAERGVGVAVLKVGESERGSGGRDGAHGRAGRRPARLQGAGGGGGRGMGGRLPRPAGAGEGDGVPERPSVKGSDPSAIAVLTCSGGDSALAADECARLGLRLPLFASETAARLRDLLPDAATVGNPLDYTALIWGDVERLRDIIVTVGEDPSIDRVLVFYDQAADSGRGGSWAAVRKGIALGAAASRGTGDGRLDAARAARRAVRARIHRRRRPRCGRPADRPGLRGRPRPAGRRTRPASARSRRPPGARAPPAAARRQRAALARRARGQGAPSVGRPSGRRGAARRG